MSDLETTPQPEAGVPPQALPTEAPAAAAQAASPIKEADVWETLRMVFDPEIPVSIVDLGLVYDVRIEGQKVFVKMTLTMPGCMMGPSIAGDAQMRILSLPGVEEAQVEVVWDPPWHQSMMSEEARKRLGLDEV